jgi:hypothetical protein
MPDGRYRLILGHSRDRRYCYFATAQEAREAVEEVIQKARSDDYWRGVNQKGVFDSCVETEKAFAEKQNTEKQIFQKRSPQK